MMRRAIHILLILPALIWAKPDFPEQITCQENSYEKLGEHRYHYKRIFKVYDAALYAEPQTSTEDILNADRSFKLVFSYLRAVDKQLAIEAADRALAKNLDEKEVTAISSRLTELNEAYLSAEKGDTTSLHYQPGKGTTYTFNGEPRVTIPGQDFARLYFRVWLGEQPLSKALREDLLALE